ncbi:hypothetical protein Tco_0839908 [Tanacetum coccineum]|uniref:Uncharacterized protein n=1 Tax=Tanacetum coccineum TaxID=301880 RepID=A0ABQ5AWJ1_9ASTR
MVINSPCLTEKKELAIPGQTTTGKEFSNPLMAGSLPKTISTKVCTASTNLYASLTSVAYTVIQLVHNQAPEGEGGDSVERAITIVASLDAVQDSDNIIRTQTTTMPNVDIPQGMDTGGSPKSQETMGGTPAQTRSKRVLAQPNEPPLSEGHTSRSGDGKMEHQFELTANVLDLEKEKDAQAIEILILKRRAKKLERKRKSSISHPRRRKYKQDFEELDDYMENVEEETVDAAATGVSTVSAPVSTAGVTISTAEPRTPPTTTVFDDEDVTMAMAQTLIKMKEQKAKEKGVAITDVEDSSRIVRPVRSITTLQPLPTIDPKDKGKGVLVEEEPVKIKMRDQGDLQVQADAELAQRLHEEELAELERAQQERQRQEDDTNAPLAKEFDEIQARIDADHELAVRLTHEEQEKYIIKERARLLAEFFDQRKKQLAAARAEAIRNKPPIKTQVRNMMITYLKHMEKRRLMTQPMDTETIKDSERKVDSSSKPAEGSRKKILARKRAGEKKSEESAKKKKLEDVAEDKISQRG